MNTSDAKNIKYYTDISDISNKLRREIYSQPLFNSFFANELLSLANSVQRLPGTDQFCAVVLDSITIPHESSEYYRYIGEALNNAIIKTATSCSIKGCIGLPCPIYHLFTCTAMVMDGKKIIQIFL